jgi:predicted aminopeptidase
VPREEKLAEKAVITTRLRDELKITRQVTNATLIQFKTYGSGRDELVALLQACDGSFPRFLRAMERVRAVARSARPHSDPGILLRPVVAEGCQ